MNDHQISIAFQTDKTPSEYIALAKLVDQYDFDVVSVYCDAPFHPSYGPLLLMAPYIKRARLGPAAVSPFRIHPIDIAANTALLAAYANGGVYIGLARGAWLEEHGIKEPSKPIQGIREAVMIIRNLLKGDPAGFEGQVFRIANHVQAPYPIPNVPIPLMIGTWGPKLAALAGELADEIKVGGSTNPAVAKEISKDIKLGIKKSGRQTCEVGMVFGAVTVVDEDRCIARRTAKRELTRYFPVVANLDRTENYDPVLLSRVQDLVNLGDLESAEMLISDHILEKFAFAGDANDVIQQAERLFDADVNRIEFGTPHGVNAIDGIRLLGENVLPILRSWMLG